MSYIVYLTFLSVNLLIIRIYENINNKSFVRTILFTILCLSIYIFGSIRFDVGNDYLNYYGHYWFITNKNGYISPDYFIFDILSKFFSFTEYGYIGVFSIYFIITLSIILIILKKYNILFWGFFTFVTWGLLFDTFDRIRQMVVVAIFLLSLNNIEKNEFSMFIFKMMIACTFHLSAVILIPFYFIAKIRINVVMLTLIVCILVFGYIFSVWQHLIKYIYTIVPYYNNIYSESDYSSQFNELNSGLGVFGKIIFIYLNIIFAPIEQRSKTLLSVGLIIYILGIGNLNVERISDYFLAIVIISFPYMIKKFKKIENKILIVFPMILFLLILFIKSIEEGYFKYQTIFGEEFKKQNFKERVYSK